MNFAPLPVAALAAAGGEPTEVPLEDRVAPSVYSWTDISGKVNTLSLGHFNANTLVALRKEEGRLTEQILGEFGKILRFELGGKLGKNTAIVISARARGDKNEGIILKADEKFFHNGGILVPCEHALAYTKLLVQRYRILSAQGNWDELSVATKGRISRKKSSQRIEKEKREAARESSDTE